MLRNAFDSILNIKLSRLESSVLIQAQLNENALKYSAKSLRNQRGFISAVLNFSGYSMPEVAVKPSENKTISVPNKQEVERIIMLLKDVPNIECQI